MHAASSTQETHHQSYETVSSQPFSARFSLWVFFHISVINESLFQQEMRFSFPLFPFIHPSPLPSFSFCFASSLHPHLHSSTVSPSGLLATFLCWFLSSLLASPRRCRSSSSVRTLRDASSPRKRRCSITAISCKEIHTQRNLTCSRISEKKLLAITKLRNGKKNRVDNKNLN